MSRLKMIRTVLYILLVASFAVWFGGFTFYVSFVVPTGTEVLGSSFEQGLVTRQVTKGLNWLGLLAGLMMLLNCWLPTKSVGTRRIRVQMISAIAMLLMQAALFWLHPQIDAYVDVEIGDIAGDYDQFYFLHRLYLWGSTVQWIAAWIWLIAFATSQVQLANKANV